jgi:itaconyl-CoA hydratase
VSEKADRPSIDLDDLPIGLTSRTAGRTITATEMQLIHRLAGCLSPLHVNDQYGAENTPFGAAILGGGPFAGMVAAGFSDSELYTLLRERHRIKVRSALGMTIRYRDPVLAGDSVYYQYRVDSARPSESKPGFAVMTVGMKAENQRGKPLVEGELTFLFERS